MRRLETEPASFWRRLVRSLMLVQKKIVIRGKPSKQLMEKMGNEEKERVAQQRDELGACSLLQLGLLYFKSVRESFSVVFPLVIRWISFISADSYFVHCRSWVPLTLLSFYRRRASRSQESWIGSRDKEERRRRSRRVDRLHPHSSHRRHSSAFTPTISQF